MIRLHPGDTRRSAAMVILGLAAGTVAGLLGIGGGVLIVPGLVLALGFDQHRAHGTSLLAVLLISLSGAITYAVHHNVSLVMAAELAIGGVAGAIVGGRFVHRLDGRALRLTFCALLIFVSIRMFVHGWRGADSTSGAGLGPDGTALATLVTLAAGVFSGLLSSVLGLGGGIILVPAMVMLLGVGQKLAQGTSFSAMAVTTSIAVLIYRRNDNVDPVAGRLVGVGGIAGGIVGGTLAAWLPSSVLRLCFSGFLMLIAVLLAFRKHPDTALVVSAD